MLMILIQLLYCFRVSCLCTQLEAVLQHQLKQPSKGLSMSKLKQVGTRPVTEDVTFWEFVKSHLTKHEMERYVFFFNLQGFNIQYFILLLLVLLRFYLQSFVFFLLTSAKTVTGSPSCSTYHFPVLLSINNLAKLGICIVQYMNYTQDTE